jgi:AraC family transcriptional regulator
MLSRVGIYTSQLKPLAQIAVAAGFADQTHCTRRFHELVGITPEVFAG